VIPNSNIEYLKNFPNVFYFLKILNEFRINLGI